MNRAQLDIFRTLQHLIKAGDLTICKRVPTRAGGVAITMHTPDGIEVLDSAGGHFGTFG